MSRSLATSSLLRTLIHIELRKKAQSTKRRSWVVQRREKSISFQGCARVSEWVSRLSERKKCAFAGRDEERNQIELYHFRCGNGRSLSINAYVLSCCVFPSIGWLGRMFDVNPANKQMRVVNINSTAAPSFCNQSILSCSDDNSELFSLTHRRVNGL